MPLYAIAYDIPDDRRRAKVAKLLKRYGKHVQYSVFELEVNRKLLLQALRELRRHIDEEADSVFVYTLAGAPQRLSGSLKVEEDDGFVV